MKVFYVPYLSRSVQRVSILSLTTFMSLSFLACSKKAAEESNSNTASIDASNDSLKVAKIAIINSSRIPLANLANSLGFAWAGGCHGAVGEDMKTVWESKETAFLVSNFDGSPDCGPQGQHNKDRLKIKYAFTQDIKEIETHLEKKVTSNLLIKSFNQASFSPNSVKQNIELPVSYTYANSVTNSVTGTFSSSVELGMEFGGSLFGLATAKTTIKTTIGGSVGKTSTTQETDSTTVTPKVAFELPPEHCAVITGEVYGAKTTIPYSATVEVLAAVELQGYMRVKACGGNFHRKLRNKKDHEAVAYVLGDKTDPFWDKLSIERDINNGMFDYTAAMMETDCFDHGKEINAAIASLDEAFGEKKVQSISFNGILEEVRSTNIVFKPHIYPAGSEECKGLGL